MRRMVCGMAPVALVVAAALAPGDALAQDTSKFYEENCAVCHSIGGGDQAGPDLKGITDRKDRRWLIRFLLDPEAIVKSGDEYAVKLVETWGGVVMPATDGLTREIAEELVEYIERESRRAATQPATQPAPVFTAGDRARGLDIFTGRVRLARGGPSCVSCHGLGGVDGTTGGMFGPDLAAVYTRLGGTTGTTAWLARPPTPVMRAVYRRASLTEDESRSLAALFDSTATAVPVAAPAQRWWLALVGVAGAIAGLAAIGLVWHGRLRSVRRRLTDRTQAGPRNRT